MDPDQESKFAIHAAAREGRTAAVEALFNANPKLVTLKDDDGRLPIHWATSYNHRPIVELLVSQRNFDPDIQDASGWTPLMIACSLREEDGLVEMLLSKDADVNMKNNADQTALHFTASKSNLQSARTLLAHGATARARDKRGQYPLHRAAAVGSVPMVNLLLEKKSPLDATDISGLTALHHAISEGHGDAAMTLLRAGAASDKRDENEKLAIELAPDGKVRSFILRACEREGIELEGVE